MAEIEIPPALSPLTVDFRVRQVICHHQNDRGFGDSEPYLLTLFFKVDGDTVSLTNEFALTGTATFQPTPGTHGNLSDVDVATGDTVLVPPAIGSFTTTLRGIQLPDPCDALLPGGVSGVIGVICALLEQDGVRDDAAEAGHDAFNEVIIREVNEIVNTLSIDNQEIPEDAKDAIAEQVKDAFKKAVFGATGFLGDLSLVVRGLLFAAGDDPLLEALFLFKHSELAEQGTISFALRPNEGETEDWEITGDVSVAESCLANAVGRMATPSTLPDFRALRAFRNREIVSRPHVGEWLALASRHGATLLRPLRRDAKLRSAAVQALAAAGQATGQRDRPVPAEHLATVRRVIDSALPDAPPAARHDLERLREALPGLEGRTPNEMLRILDARGPASTRKVRRGVPAS